jgi:hypothetical protein
MFVHYNQLNTNSLPISFLIIIASLLGGVFLINNMYVHYYKK